MSPTMLAYAPITSDDRWRRPSRQPSTHALPIRVLAVAHPHGVVQMRERLHRDWDRTVRGNILAARDGLRKAPDILLLDGQLPYRTLLDLCCTARTSSGGSRLAILLLIDPLMPAYQIDALDVDVVLPHSSDHTELFWWVTTLVRTQRFTSLSEQGAVEQLIAALHAKDTVSDGHLNRIERYAMAIGQKMELSPLTLRALRYGALLHDVGKVGIANTLLSKPASLTNSEYLNIKQHPVVGAKIIQRLNIDPLVTQIVRHHHERWDGTGYPDGLRGDAIPLFARIVAVADAFDAMTSKRPYNIPRSHTEASTELQKGRGTYWDPRIVDVFVKWLEMSNHSLHARKRYDT